MDREAGVAGAGDAREGRFVGRERELAEIAAAREAGALAGVVVVAAAGIGKSRLARQAVGAAVEAGSRVHWVQATRSAATVPLGAFAGLIPPDTPAEDTLALMRSTAGWLRTEAGSRPVVLGVDDAQLLDPTSAALVLHLAITGAVFAVVTLRRGEPRPDAVDALWKDAGLELLELGAFDPARTGEVVEATLGAPAEERVRQWAYERSRGNVLYVSELLSGALAGGALQEREGLWRLTREPPPSATLADLIRTRMAGTDAEEWRALELLALGEPLPLGELTQLTGLEPLTGIESRNLIASESASADTRVRLAHPLYGEVVRASMPAIRARAARLELATLVQSRPSITDDERLRVARWLLDAGEPVPPELALAAAAAANLAGDPDLGARLAELALGSDGGARAALELARAHEMRKRFADAEAVLAAAEEEFTDQARALEALEHRVMLLYWMLHRPEDALEFLARAAQRWPGAAWRARVESVRLYLLMWQEPDAAIAAADAVLAEPGTPPEVRPRIERVRAGALFYAGRGREAQALAATLRPTAPLPGTHEHAALDLCGLIEYETGEDLEGATTWLTALVREAVAANDDAAAGLAALTLADVHRVRGRLHDADRWAAEAIAHLERRDPFGYLAFGYGRIAAIAYERGDPDAVAAAIARYRETADVGTDVAEVPNLARTEAWALLSEGDPPKARDVLLDAAERCASMPLYELSLRYEAMRAGAPAAALVARADALAARCDARLADCFIAHTRARAEQDAPELSGVAERFAAAGALRYASEAAAHAAEAFAADGRTDSARRATRRCHELHELGQGGTAPVIRGIDAASVRLTPREEQFVALAARGLTNAEIADRLVLSVRTVESHLYRAMQKLGVSDRRDLRAR